MSNEESRGCLKTGCWGCVAVLGLGFVGMLVLSGVAFVSANVEAEPTTDSASYDLPREPLLESARPDNIATEEQLSDVRQSLDLQTQAVVSTGVGTLELDLSAGSFTLVPVEADEELEVIADYDKARYRLTEEFEQAEGGDWTYRVKFSARRSVMFGAGPESRVEIRVPKGHPLSILGEIKMGQAEMDFGGLALKAVDLQTGMGEFEFDISEPTPVPAERFRVSGRMGQLTVDSLGNASPEAAELRFRMGEVSVDLEGSWRNDSQISIRCSMGECGARVPEDVFVDVDASAAMGGRSVRLPDQSAVPEGAPTLAVKVVTSMGEARIR
ncbi:MAG: hypothetical protein AAF690_17485 [Acidobacteriota bacterium]